MSKMWVKNRTATIPSRSVDANTETISRSHTRKQELLIVEGHVSLRLRHQRLSREMLIVSAALQQVFLGVIQERHRGEDVRRGLT